MKRVMALVVSSGLTLFPVVGFAQALAPPVARSFSDGKKAKAEGLAEEKGHNLDGDWYLANRLADSEVSKLYFGEKSLSLLEWFSFNGLLSEGKSISGRLIGFRIYDNFQVSIYTAITDSKSTAPTGDSAGEQAVESNLENFIESGGNLTITGEVPLAAFFKEASAAAGLNTIASVSVMGLINADVDPLGVSTDNALRVSQLGLRFYGHKAAIDNGDVAAFAEATVGGLWGTADFFSSIGQAGRRGALYGKATVGLLLFKRFRLNLNKVFMGPEKMRGPWILSMGVAPVDS